MTTKTKEDRLEEVGKSSLSCLRDMVAALECDYDRLEELREERDDLYAEWKQARDDEDAALNGAPDADYDNAKTLPAKADALEEWDAENLADMRDLINAAGECKSREDAIDRIMEDPLSIQFRGGWHDRDSESEDEEFMILLTTGGPAVRIIGEFGQGRSIHRVYLQVQDWGTPWTDYYEENISDVLEAYCHCLGLDC